MNSADENLGLVVLAVLAAAYFLPSICAAVRRHPSGLGIVSLNLFLGWTFIGWVVALVWSLSNTAVPKQTVIVNNHGDITGSKAKESRDQRSISQAAYRQAPQQADMQCPMCAEVIKATARKCRFCGEYFSLPFAAVQAEYAEWEEVPNDRKLNSEILRDKGTRLPAPIATGAADSPWKNPDFWASIGSGSKMLALSAVAALVLLLAIGIYVSPKSDPNDSKADASRQIVSAATATVRDPVILDFNAIGPYVNEHAGHVCEGERWVRPTENSIVWQGEKDEYMEFFYQYDGKTMNLTNKATGKQTSFPMRHLPSGKWMLNGKVLEECAG